MSKKMIEKNVLIFATNAFFFSFSSVFFLTVENEFMFVVSLTFDFVTIDVLTVNIRVVDFLTIELFVVTSFMNIFIDRPSSANNVIKTWKLNFSWILIFFGSKNLYSNRCYCFDREFDCLFIWRLFDWKINGELIFVDRSYF